MGLELSCKLRLCTDTRSADGKELDVFFLSINKPLKKARGVCIAIIHRLNDDEDKLVVVPLDSKELSNEEIEEQIIFQEKVIAMQIIKLQEKLHFLM